MLALALAGCGEKSEPEPAPPVPPTTTQDERSPGGRDGNGDGSGEGARETDPRAKREREAERVVRAYFDAIDEREGARVCALLARGALAEINLPRRRATCAASLDASIGYRDPRGLPQFESVAIAGPPAIRATRAQARLTVPVVTEFADREQASVEDDIVYLVREDGRYRVAKASSALYRAVGIGDIPPSVLAPP